MDYMEDLDHYDSVGCRFIGLGTILSTQGFNMETASHLEPGDKVALVQRPGVRPVRAMGTPYCWGSIGRHYRLDFDARER